MWEGRSVASTSTNVFAKFRCTPLRIKKALGILRELITTRTRTRVAFRDAFLRVQKYSPSTGLYVCSQTIMH